MPASQSLRQLAGQPVDIAPFGEVRYWTGSDAHSIEPHTCRPREGAYHPQDVSEQGGPHLGVEWQIPRQFERVVVRYAATPPGADEVKLQYWNHNWPADWRGGWTHIDDPHNGRWVTANGDVTRDGDNVTYVFDPLDFTEIERAEDFAVRYRQSYRIRLLFADGHQAPVEAFEVYSRSTWRILDCTVEHGDAVALKGEVEITNGYLVSQKTGSGELALEVLAADCGRQVDVRLMPVAPDRTVVTVPAHPQSFSFALDDALGDEPIRIPDLGVTIGSSSNRRRRKNQTPPKPIFDRILDEPEQTWERARSEVPELVKIRQGRYVPLGCDANRQEFALRFSGHIYADKRQMKVSGRDTARLLWPGTRIEYKFPTMDPPDFREREDTVEQSAMNGYLPIYTSRWTDRQIEFEKTDFAALLLESPEDEQDKRGDEPVCVFSRVRVRNRSEDPMTARFWVVIENPEVLEVRDGGFIYATARIENESWPWHKEAVDRHLSARAYDAPRMRAHLDRRGKGVLRPSACCFEPHRVSGYTNSIAYDIPLEPREQHTFEMKIPFVTFTEGEGRAEVRAADYDAKLAEMVQYWDRKIGDGADISVPDELITDFVKATIPHIAITADKDVDTGHYLLPAATYSYNVCANEALHQVRSLDMRGLHSEARKYLMPFVECQSSRPMHGKFKSQDGVLHGLRTTKDRDYQTFNYNLDHGFVLFGLCEHYFLTRDREWAESIAGNLVQACDFVTRERQYTMKTAPDGQKVPEYGLIPPGHLEDNPEWLYWYAVNAYCHRGMAATAEVLRDIGHTEAARVAADTEAFRSDLRNSMRLHMERSPATELADGSFVPFTPTRAQLCSRDLGWIRESLYGPIHAIECGVLDPGEDQSTWILKDSEDNVFVHKYRGRQVDLERHWFSHGGNTIQSGLLPMVMVYVKRDQPEHAIRCLFNAFAQNIYADVRCFTEHPVSAYGLGVGPFYKTPDESCWVNWLRHVLVSEVGYDGLRVGPAVPRCWMEHGKTVSAQGMATYFGPVSLTMESLARDGEIHATIQPPKRNPPESLELRLRHPEGKRMKRVQVNGMDWPRIDPAREVISLSGLRDAELNVTAFYEE